MKQRLFSLFMLLLGIAAGAEAGNLTIGSTTLDVGNYYTEWSGMTCLWEGTITFTDANHVTFENVTLNFNSGNNTAISTDIPNLTITLVGENKIQGAGIKKGIYFSQYMTINGDGSLDIVANENGIEGTGGNTLTITDAHVKAKGGTYGIRLGSSGLLVKGNGVFEAYGGTKCLQGVKSLGEGNTVAAPSGAKFLSSALSVVDASNNPISNEWVTILRGIAINETNFPDANFRNWVLDQDYGADGMLKDEEIEQVKVIDVSSRRITNLKGIEYFTALTELYCFDNLLTSLDVSKNTALTQLSCAINQLTALDVLKNTALQTLLCEGNQLTTLDISKNTALTYLSCGANQLTSLSLLQNTALQTLSCSDNQLTTLDVSNNESLLSLVCNTNQLTSLDVSKNTVLSSLQCAENKLTTLDVSKNKELLTIMCYSNAIRGKDMTAFVNSLPAEAVEGCDNCKVLKVYKDETDGNEITTLQVTIARAKGWKVQTYDGSNYEGVHVVVISQTNFPDANFRSYVTSKDKDTDGYLTESEIAAVTDISVSGMGIASLTGIKFFTALTSLFCDDNQLTALDVSKNTALSWLNCRENQLTTLNVSKNTALTYLDCCDNQLTTLDVSQNTALTKLYCGSNQLTSLDVSNNTALTEIYCYGNAIRFAGMTTLVNSLPDRSATMDGILNVYFDETPAGNKITTLQVAAAKKKGWKVQMRTAGDWVEYEGADPGIAIDETNFPDGNFRTWVLAQDYGKDGNLDEDEIAAVTKIYVSGKGIASLKGIEFFTALTELHCEQNLLTSLDVSKNTALTELECSENQLTSLDVSNNKALHELGCTVNPLTTIDVSKNTALEELYCCANQLTSLDVSNNKALHELGCYINNIRGAGMNTLVNSLPEIPEGSVGNLYPIFDLGITTPYGEEKNIITTVQVKIAKNKGWKVLKPVIRGDGDMDLVDYEGVLIKGDVNGDGEVDAKDVVDLINYLRGALAGDKSQFDVNGDGEVNAADVVSLVNIITE